MDDGASRTFPRILKVSCNTRSDARCIAFSCRWFYRLFRQSYITRLFFRPAFRPSKKELSHYKAVTGAFVRFNVVKTVAVGDIGCIDLKNARTTQDLCTSAGNARRMISTAAYVGLRSGCKATKLQFYAAGTKGCRFIKRLWKWRKEREQWLDCLPDVTTV